MASCKIFYQKQFGLRAAQTSMFCMSENDSVNNFWNVTAFNFYTDLFRSCKTWMNVYLNNDTHSPNDYIDLLLTTGMEGSSITSLIHSKASKIKAFLQTNVFEKVFNHYYNTSCTEPDCIRYCQMASQYKTCTNKELVYLQWINQTVLRNPPPSIGLEATSESYIRAFPDWTVMTYTPELGYYLDKAGLKHFPVSVSQVRTFMQPNRLFNQEIISDILLDVHPITYSPVFTNAEMARYLKFVIIEGGLGGIFLKRTPK